MSIDYLFGVRIDISKKYFNSVEIIKKYVPYFSDVLDKISSNYVFLGCNYDADIRTLKKVCKCIRQLSKNKIPFMFIDTFYEYYISEDDSAITYINEIIAIQEEIIDSDSKIEKLDDITDKIFLAFIGENSNCLFYLSEGAIKASNISKFYLDSEIYKITIFSEENSERISSGKCLAKYLSKYSKYDEKSLMRLLRNGTISIKCDALDASLFIDLLNYYGYVFDIVPRFSYNKNDFLKPYYYFDTDEINYFERCYFLKA